MCCCGFADVEPCAQSARRPPGHATAAPLSSLRAAVPGRLLSCLATCGCAGIRHVMAGVTEDDAARFAYLAEGNAKQARKRVAADVLITDRVGRVLLVDPTYKEGWDIPGGMVEANEPPRVAAERELREELGLTLT